jgi:hypothetical protein
MRVGKLPEAVDRVPEMGEDDERIKKFGENLPRTLHSSFCSVLRRASWPGRWGSGAELLSSRRWRMCWEWTSTWPKAHRFIVLPPLGLGGLWVYWKRGQADLPAGIACTLGGLIGEYFGGRVAAEISS